MADLLKTIKINHTDNIVICKPEQQGNSLIKTIFDRIKAKNKNVNFCGFGTANCSASTLYFYVTTLPNSTLDVCGYLSVVEKDSHAEIYDVYTFNHYRKTRKPSVADHLIKVATATTTKSIIWLGILFSNPHFDIAARLYAKNGFRFHRITNMSYDGTTNFGNFYMGLVAKTTDQPVPGFEEALKEILTEKELYMNSCTSDKTYSFDPETIKFLYAQLSKEHEVGGHFKLEGTNILKVDGQQYTGNTTGVSYGTLTEFMYHTHPTICYQENGCALGWPSGGDMLTAMMAFNKIRVNVVSTCEGIYIFQLSTEMHMFLRQLKEVLNEIFLDPRTNPQTYLFDLLASIVEKSFTEILEHRLNLDERRQHLTKKIEEQTTVLEQLKTEIQKKGLSPDYLNNLSKNKDYASILDTCISCTVKNPQQCEDLCKISKEYIEKLVMLDKLQTEFDIITQSRNSDAYCRSKHAEFMEFANKQYTLNSALNMIAASQDVDTLIKVRSYMESYMDKKARAKAKLGVFGNELIELIMPELEELLSATTATVDYNPILQKIQNHLRTIMTRASTIIDLLTAPVFNVQFLEWQFTADQPDCNRMSCAPCITSSPMSTNGLGTSGLSTSGPSTSGPMSISPTGSPKAKNVAKARLSSMFTLASTTTASRAVQAASPAQATTSSCNVTLKPNTFMVNKCLYIDP